MFEILRTDGDLCVRHEKAQSVSYIDTIITIDCDLIDLRRDILRNPRYIRGTTSKDRSRLHPRNKYCWVRRRSRCNCESKFRSKRKRMICFKCVSKALRHEDVIMNRKKEREGDRERRVDKKKRRRKKILHSHPHSTLYPIDVQRMSFWDIVIIIRYPEWFQLFNGYPRDVQVSICVRFLQKK